MTCRHPAYRTRRCAERSGQVEFARTWMQTFPTLTAPELGLHRVVASFQLANRIVCPQVENLPPRPAKIPTPFSGPRYFSWPSSSVSGPPGSARRRFSFLSQLQSPKIDYLFAFPPEAFLIPPR